MGEATKDLLYNISGVIGVSMMIATYFLLQIEKIDPKKLHYSLINFIGAALVVVSLMRFWNLSSFIIEIFWLGISGYGIYKALKRK